MLSLIFFHNQSFLVSESRAFDFSFKTHFTDILSDQQWMWATFWHFRPELWNKNILQATKKRTTSEIVTFLVSHKAKNEQIKWALIIQFNSVPPSITLIYNFYIKDWSWDGLHCSFSKIVMKSDLYYPDHITIDSAHVNSQYLCIASGYHIR